MLKERSLVNRCYILRESLGEDIFCEKWRASAIFSASDFLFRLVKAEFSDSPEIAGTPDVFAIDALRSHDVSAPSVLDLVEIDKIDGRLFLVTEYCGYTSLRSELSAGLSISLERACRLVIELAEGIDAFHQKAIAYGALCPESVIVHRSGDRIEELKIQNPSYSTMFSRIPEDRIDEIRDTWGYAAPEIKLGLEPGFRSDLYSLGILLFRLIVGKLPYGSRSGLRVKQRSAAPGHIAASLARRRVPKTVAAIILRALRKNPLKRYPDAVSFIADLRTFLEARREASLRSGGVDPIADLATLNLKRAKAGAYEIVRSLETTDYFRFLSEAAVNPVDRKDLIDLMRTFESNQQVEDLEELEAEGAEDDDERDIESYIDEGYTLAASEFGETESPPSKSQPAAPAPSPAAPTPSTPGYEPPPAAALPSRQPPPANPPVPAAAGMPAAAFVAPAAVGGAPAYSAGAPAYSAGAPRVAAIAPAEASGASASSSADAEGAPVPRQIGIHWKRSGGTPGEIALDLDRSLERARTGRGSFKFIEDPGTGDSAELLRRTLDRFKRNALVIDIGRFPSGAALADFGLSILETLKSRAEIESESRRRSFRRMLRKMGPWNGTPEYLVRCVRNLSRRDRPLVLLGRGAESIDPSFLPFFTALAGEAPGAPYCACFFFEKDPSGSWRVLGTLSGSEPTPTSPPRS